MTEKTIESRSNPRYKALRLLTKTGFDSSMILVEGPKLIDEALKAGLQPDCFWSYAPAPMAKHETVYLIPEKMYRAASPTKSGQPPLALFATPTLAPITAQRLRRGRYLLLDQVQEPGNAGALVRAAVGFGLDGVLWRKPCVFPFHHACIRASAGTLFHIKQYLVDDAALDAADVCWIGAESEGGSSLASFSWPRDLVLAMGNEGHGLSPAVKKRLRETVSIPISAHAESLNVAGAAHILMYEMSRN